MIVFAITISGVIVAGAYPVTEKQIVRLEKYIPGTYAKLGKREPVLIVGLGDSVTMFKSYGAHNGDLSRSFLGRFAHRLEREFFYTGGVIALDSETGLPVKKNENIGPEITILSMASEDGTSLHAFQRLTTDAFLYEPDLILINYGINDALDDYPQEEFREALERSITLCQEHGVDVIVMGSSAVIQSKGPTGLGLERPFANAAREAAEKKGVLFVDFGSAMIEGVGVPFDMDPEQAVLAAAAQLKKHFDHGPGVEDFIHPNERSHEFLGDRIHRVLFEGLAEEPYMVSGWCAMANEGRVEVEFDLRNESESARRGYLCTLDSGRWLSATNPFHRFEIEPRKSARFKVSYQLHRSPVYTDDFAFERLGGRVASYLPILIADDERTRITGFVPVNKPIEVVWQTGFQDEVREAFKVACNVTNTSGKPVAGDYTVRWGPQNTSGKFSLEKGESRDLEVTIKLPEKKTIVSIRSSMDAVFRIDGKEYIFRREIEAMQNLSLGQHIQLIPETSYRPNEGLLAASAESKGVFVRAAADEEALYVVFEIPQSIEFKEAPGKDSMRAELTIDARSYGERREFGFVDKMRIGVGANDGSGTTGNLERTMFGNGYNKVLDPAGIVSVLKTGPDGARRFTVVIPRHYLHLHEWQLGNPNSLIGFKPALSFLDVTPEDPGGHYPAARRYVFASGRLAEVDPRSLPALELSEKASVRWSVRLY